MVENDPVLQVLFPEGKAIGQSFNRFQPDKRIVRVESYEEAYGFFLRMHNDGMITAVLDAENACYLFPLTGKDGYLCFTNNVQPGHFEVAVLWVISDSINRMGVRSVHFVETIKKRRFR